MHLHYNLQTLTLQSCNGRVRSIHQQNTVSFFFTQHLLQVLSVETAVASIKKNFYGFWWNDNVGFHTFSSWRATCLWKCSCEDDNAFFARVFEEFKFLLSLSNIVEHIFAGNVGFDVASGSVFVAE